MAAPLIPTLRSRWFAVCVHIGLWLLLYLAISRIGGRAPDFRDDISFSLPTLNPAPVAKMGRLFSAAAWPKTLVSTNAVNPFFTRYFVPPTPPPAPTPTTRKIELSYQGYFQLADGLKRAVVKIGESFVVAPVGATVAVRLFVADATMQSVTLTNHLAQTNVVLLNAKKEFEVPLQ